MRCKHFTVYRKKFCDKEKTKKINKLFRKLKREKVHNLYIFDFANIFLRLIKKYYSRSTLTFEGK